MLNSRPKHVLFQIKETKCFSLGLVRDARGPTLLITECFSAPGDLLYHTGESIDNLCFIVSGKLFCHLNTNCFSFSPLQSCKLYSKIFRTFFLLQCSIMYRIYVWKVMGGGKFMEKNLETCNLEKKLEKICKIWRSQLWFLTKYQFLRDTFFIFRNVRYFLKGFFPKWQLPKWQFPKRKLPKCAIS